MRLSRFFNDKTKLSEYNTASDAASQSLFFKVSCFSGTQRDTFYELFGTSHVPLLSTAQKSASR